MLHFGLLWVFPSRFGVPDFLRVWAAHGGSLEVLATTPEDADDIPGAEVVVAAKHDFIDTVPTLQEVRTLGSLGGVT